MTLFSKFEALIELCETLFNLTGFEQIADDIEEDTNHTADKNEYGHTHASLTEIIHVYTYYLTMSSWTIYKSTETQCSTTSITLKTSGTQTTYLLDCISERPGTAISNDKVNSSSTGLDAI